MAAPAVIEFEGVGLAYAAQSGAPTVALDDLRCRFMPGKVTAIIGPSGCGKSTMLQIARGFLDPTAGRLRFVALGGSTPAARPAMSTVWQAFNLFPWLTVIENVEFGLRLGGSRARGAEAPVGDLGLVQHETRCEYVELRRVQARC